ncbi:bifunctional adenosylcobinamide kinase/adenosylcobinamide-phosphate guanylyltransferase [Halomonas sp. E19]|uniref:bifunctional adenosylcobinamide kinase/adenosylcobinamide-phosphate guanylyltransferase n=1 Tax=Halomonas sp. E19 TaxID=3397247 RepID=UPI00403352DB
MQLFIGGTCAGKRDAVRQRFDAPHWHSAHARDRLEAWPSVADSSCLVLEGWERWIGERLAAEPDDDRLRQAMVRELDALRAWEAERGGQAVLILLEMGRGIVPSAARTGACATSTAGWSRMPRPAVSRPGVCGTAW